MLGRPGTALPKGSSLGLPDGELGLFCSAMDGGGFGAVGLFPEFEALGWSSRGVGRDGAVAILGLLLLGFGAEVRGWDVEGAE